jgi:hypothetical protein
MASLLATLVLDDNTMERLADRGEAPLLFQACLKLLSLTMAKLKQDLATDNIPQAENQNILISEGAEQQQQQKESDSALGTLGSSSSEGSSLSGNRQEVGTSVPPAAGSRGTFNVQQAVSLAEACSQGVWGSAHYCLKDPLEISQV